MKFRWKKRVLAIHEAYKLVKEITSEGHRIKPETVCDYIICGWDSDYYCKNVEWMTKAQFQRYVKEVAELLKLTA